MQLTRPVRMIANDMVVRGRLCCLPLRNHQHQRHSLHKHLISQCYPTTLDKAHNLYSVRDCDQSTSSANILGTTESVRSLLQISGRCGKRCVRHCSAGIAMSACGYMYTLSCLRLIDLFLALLRGYRASFGRFLLRFSVGAREREMKCASLCVATFACEEGAPESPQVLACKPWQFWRTCYASRSYQRVRYRPYRFMRACWNILMLRCEVV